MNNRILGLYFLPVAGLVLGGCAEPPTPNDRRVDVTPYVCEAPPCIVNIRIPGEDQAEDRPRAEPEFMVLSGGEDLQFEIEGGAETRGALVVVFEEAIVRRGDSGPWLYTIPLNPRQEECEEPEPSQDQDKDSYQDEYQKQGQGQNQGQCEDQRNRNTFTVRPHEDGLCLYPDNPCRYVVINAGQPHRRSLINSPMVGIQE